MTNYLIEIWANIKNHDDYQVSNLGRICSYKNNERKIIKGWIQNTGYLTVVLDNKKYSVHRLVAETFIHKTKDKDTVNHIDGNKLNNNVNNLEWCTLKENIQHAFESGLMDNAIKQMKVKKIRAKRINQYDLDGNYIKTYLGSIEAQNELRKLGIKVNDRNIRKVCQGKRKKAGGYKWRYTEVHQKN
jgi:hypothetical protein